MKRIAVVVDMQNDFVDGSLGTAEAVKIVSAVCDRLSAERAAGALVVFTRDTHGTDYLDTFEGKRLPVPHCIRGSAGHSIISALEPFTDDALVVDKPTFGSVRLMELLREYTGPDTVFTVMGLCTDICVISNALLIRANFPGNPITVPAACCAGVTPESHRAALTAMRMCQIDVEE